MWDYGRLLHDAVAFIEQNILNHMLDFLESMGNESTFAFQTLYKNNKQC